MRHGHEREHELLEHVLQYNTIHIHTYLLTLKLFPRNKFTHPSVRPSASQQPIHLSTFLIYTEHIQKEHISHQSKTNIEYLPTYLDTERKKEEKNPSSDQRHLI